MHEEYFGPQIVPSSGNMKEIGNIRSIKYQGPMFYAITLLQVKTLHVCFVSNSTFLLLLKFFVCFITHTIIQKSEVTVAFA